MPMPVYHSVLKTAGTAVLSLVLCSYSTPGMARNAQNSVAERAVANAPADPAAPISGTHVLAGQTYADLVDLVLASPVVARATIHRQSRLKPDESPGLVPGFVRLYVEADTNAALFGPELGESLRFLADVALDSSGKVPKLVHSQVLLLGNIVPGKPGELRLTAADTMFAWSPELESRLRAILTELISPDAPPRVTGLREALHVPGNLTGEGESQIFFTTDTGKPVSISVVRRPGEPTRWGVSFAEIVDEAAQPPRPETLAWYRLACSLPGYVPDRAAISASPADKQIAAEDYALVLHELGPCLRNRLLR